MTDDEILKASAPVHPPRYLVKGSLHRGRAVDVAVAVKLPFSLQGTSVGGVKRAVLLSGVEEL